jgi:hypothetical protein
LIATLTRKTLTLGSVIAALVLAGSLSAGCQNGVTGPSLAASVNNLTLQPTVAGLEGGADVCCCHLVGQLTNTSTVAVDAELEFPAKGANGQVVGTAINILSNVPPGGTVSFLAVGIAAPCSSLDVNQISADEVIKLKGLWTPS